MEISFRDDQRWSVIFFQLIEGSSWKTGVKLLPLNYESCFSFSHGKVQAGSYTFFFSQQLLSNFVLLITWIMLPVSFGPVLPENKKLPKLLLATTARCPRRSRSAERFVETPHLALWQSGSSAISFKMNNASCNSRKMGINKRINQLLPE